MLPSAREHELDCRRYPVLVLSVEVKQWRCWKVPYRFVVERRNERTTRALIAMSVEAQQNTMTNGVSGYSSLQIALHWMVVVLVAFQYVAHRGMELSWRAQLRYEEAPENTLLPTYLHAGAGITILFLVLARVSLRFTRGAPPPPSDEPLWQKRLSEGVHWAIYLLLFALPLSGLAAWVFAIESAGGAHAFLTNLLLGAIGLHVSGALFQHFVRRSDVMLRMLRPEQRRQSAEASADQA